MQPHNDSINDAERTKIIKSTLEDNVIPFLERAGSLESLKEIITDEAMKNHFWGIAMPFLEAELASNIQ